MIIGVTDEEVAVVDKWIVTKKKTGYPIAVLDGQLEKLLGVPHYPYAGVIGPDGKIAYAGDSADQVLKKALKDASAGSIWPKRLTPAAISLRTGKLGEAWTSLQGLKTAGGLDDKEQKAFDKLSSYVTTTSAEVVKSASELFKKDIAYLALKEAEPIANTTPPLPATEDAQKLLTEIKALPTYDAELKGGELYASAVGSEDVGDYLAAVTTYKELLKKFEGTKIASAAKSRAQDLIQRGMPGYQSACEKCMEAKKACDKHAKKVKL